MALTGRILLTDNTEIEVSDSIIVNNSVSITMSTCRASRFDFGTFNAASLKMSVIYDDAAQKDLSGGIVQLQEEYEDEGETASEYLSEYIIDGTTVKRKRNTVTFTAYDKAIKFDKDIPANVRSTSYTALTAIQAACTACGVNLSGGLPSGSPNASVTFTLASAAVQTWRDVVMWTCQLICANAVINRNDMLEIRTAWYNSGASADFTCTASDRADIQFSDKRVYLKYLNNYSGSEIKTYTTSQTASSQSIAGELDMKKNPLLDGKSAADCDTVNQAIANMRVVSRQIQAKMFSDSSVSLGDIGDFTGGKIDVRRSIRGKVTGITWRYHGFTTVVCTAPTVSGGDV